MLADISSSLLDRIGQSIAAHERLVKSLKSGGVVLEDRGKGRMGRGRGRTKPGSIANEN